MAVPSPLANMNNTTEAFEHHARQSLRLFGVGCVGMLVGFFAVVATCLLSAGMLLTLLRILIGIWLLASGLVLVWGVHRGLQTLEIAQDSSEEHEREAHS